jgi:DNA-binding NarL/FixJ family response regulator
LALALADEIGARLVVPLVRTTLAVAALHKGDLDAAAAELERCLDKPPASRTGFLSAFGAWVQARISRDRDAPAVAVKAFAGVFDNLSANKRVLLEEPALAAWMVRTALAAGNHKRAKLVADAAEQLSANNTGFPSIIAIALHARGLLDHDPAALLQAFSDHAHPWARACAAEDASAVLVADGQLMAGLHLLESAIALYEHAGAEHDAQRARRSARQLRVRVPPTAPPPRVSDRFRLTDTECRVSGLVALGLTNAQIGERMYLSRPTIDFHLRQIFRKLGVHTGLELARLAIEHGAPWRDE